MKMGWKTLLWTSGAFCLMILARSLALQGTGAGVVLSPATVNLGRVPQNTAQQATFNIINRSSEGADVSLKEKSCSCLSVKFQRTHLNAGESSQMVVAVATAGKVGTFQSSVVVAAHANGKTQLLSADVQLRAERVAIMEPRRLDLGTVDPDQTLVPSTITIRRGESSLDWNRIVAISKAFGPQDVKYTKDGATISYQADFRREMLGQFKDVITVQLFSQGEQPVHLLQVPVDARVGANVICRPPSVFMSIHKPGETVAGTLEIIAPDKKPIKFGSVESNLNIASSPQQTQPDSMTIKYSVVMPKDEGSVNGYVIVDVETDRSQKLRIPFVGYVQP